MNYATYNKASKLRCRERGGGRRVIPQKALKVQNYILISHFTKHSIYYVYLHRQRLYQENPILTAITLNSF